MHGALRTSLWALAFAGVSLPAHYALATQTQVRSCIRVEMAGGSLSPSRGIVASDAETLIQEIATSIALSTAGMKVLDCNLVAAAEAYYEDGSHSGLPRGEYIAYNSTWLRQVAGSDVTQVHMILGHELGHFLGRHFTRPISSHDSELEADAFAGCAVGHIEGDWNALEGLLRRLRDPTTGEYPSADESVAAAMKSFDACGGSRPMPLLPEPQGEGTDEPMPLLPYRGWIYVGFNDGAWSGSNLSGLADLKPEEIEGEEFSLSRGVNLRDGPFVATRQLENGGCKHRESTIIGGLSAETQVKVLEVHRLEGNYCRNFIWAKVSPE
jgi:hypothetical protein